MVTSRSLLPLCGACAIAFVLTGCGPLVLPMVQRLEPADQQRVDQEWSNLLSPVDRVDRQTLLDVLLVCQLHALGVDRLSMHSEKAYPGGTVVMEVFYDRANPKVDRYEVGIYDGAWNLVRREAYRPQEIEAALRELFGPTPAPREDQPISAEMRARLDARESRLRAIKAATQPARRDGEENRRK